MRPTLCRARVGEAPTIEALGSHVGLLRFAVPSLKHSSRLMHRGFNQAEAIEMQLASALASALVCNAIVRLKATHAQSSLGLADRQLNTRNAFAPTHHARVLNQGLVLLVDDVVTTGATITSCARALRRAGVTTIVAGAPAIKMYPREFIRA